ncbi:MAG: cytochrome c oxidase accessory protein CcoG [Prolixibacteraceae bacterium]|jgi:cytochrome c oxidase accessory protein FixG|nr:cytochrome c oxidase accessory protein CcoG [Prolixibacteraceae bacterium]
MAEKNENSFRDRISTQSAEGGRAWVHINPPKGKLHNYRSIVATFLILFLLGAPFVKVNGQPFMLFDVLHRKFILFGKIFWTHDFHLLVIAMITMLVGLVLFTVIYGRVFCGWACPQTVLLEMVYRKVEFLIDGNARNQRRLAQSDWTFEKVWKRIIKHTLFVLISTIISHAILSFFIGADKMIEMVKGGPLSNFPAFLLMLLFSFVFYFLYTIFREQVCSILCPYGRLQGVLLDSNSIVVAYDYLRGEPRGKLTKSVGNCIDCKKCVEVCPTNIDIRNGTQLECVNCTACIDACNSIMTKIKKPKGLIRFASENEIKSGQPFKVNARIISYSIVLLVLLSVFVGLFITSKQTETSILRTSGSLYQVQENGDVLNIYNMKIINKTNNNLPIEIKLMSHEGEINRISKTDTLFKNASMEDVLLLHIHKDQLEKGSNKIAFGIFVKGEMIEEVKTAFLAP